MNAGELSKWHRWHRQNATSPIYGYRDNFLQKKNTGDFSCETLRNACATCASGCKPA